MAEQHEEITQYLDNIQFLSPNEPITRQGVERILKQMNNATLDLEYYLGAGKKTIVMWNPNLSYDKDEIVLYYKTESEQRAPEVERREFVFVLVSTKNGNTSMPNYTLVDGIPDFAKTNWRLLNPLSYLLQDLIGMREVVKEVFEKLLKEHVEEEHGLLGSQDIASNLVKKDYSNLNAPWSIGSLALGINGSGYVEKADKATYTCKLNSNGVMEYKIRYSFDSKVNQLIRIKEKKYYYEKSPIWDESDQSIFSQKYTEDDLFSVNVNRREIGLGEQHLYIRDLIYDELQKYLDFHIYAGNNVESREAVKADVESILSKFQETGDILEYTVSLNKVSENDYRLAFGWKVVEEDAVLMSEFLFKVSNIVFSKNTTPTKLEYVSFHNLRYGTNVFHAEIEFPEDFPQFVNDQYMVFFDTYGNGDFVFGYDREDIMSKEEPTYDAVVSMPMMMNKTVKGFDVMLPIHTYFNSIQKYNVGVPWNNTFTMQVIGRYR